MAERLLTLRGTAAGRVSGKPFRGPVLARRHTLAFEKVAIEVRDIVETDVIADAADLTLRMEQQLAGLADAQLRDEVGEGGARDSAELSRERGFMHLDHGTDIGQPELLHVVAPKVVQHREDLLRPDTSGAGGLPVFPRAERAGVLPARQRMQERGKGREPFESPAPRDLPQMRQRQVPEPHELDAVPSPVQQRLGFAQVG